MQNKKRFSFCDMMPNTWLNKLRDMAKSRRLRISSNNKASQNLEEDICKSPELEISSPFQPNLQHFVPNRSSQYLPTKERLDVSCDLPTRPATRLKPRSKPTSPVSVRQKPRHDIVFEIGSRSPEVKLRPILTKPIRSRATKTKVKVRPISPRGNSRAKQRRWMLESYLVMKHSSNPEKDFMESMLEMIVEKNIVKVKDLEELLACYLSLNSREYQDVIVKVFQKVWFVFFEANYI